jgi:YD repeat-containing protein
MKHIWFLLAIISIAWGFETIKSTLRSGLVKLTVIEQGNQNPGIEFTTDTLINSQTIDLSEVKIDAYFCWRSFRMPYYMPTNGIFKDSVKVSECNWSIYPRTVKCYQYDSRGRVISMQIEGSGVTKSCNLIYDGNDRIVEITCHFEKYKMTYNSAGNLLAMTIESGDTQKRLEFIYELD